MPSKGSIAVTPRSMSEAGHPALTRLTGLGYELVFPAPGRLPSEDELVAALPGCVGYLAGVEPVSRRVIEASPRLRVISRNGSGIDNIDLDAARARGICIEKALGANARGVAELALGLAFCAIRSIAWSDRHLAEGDWKRRKGRELLGKRLGIVGCGAIGRTLATLGASLGMEVLGHDPYVGTAALDASMRRVSLDELLAASDVISLHCPPAPAPILGAAALARIKPGAVLVNTARAELIDEDAVVAALDSGRLAAYATDVYPTEPPEPSALLRHENTIRTPHAGGYTDESVDRATEIAVDNLLRRLEG